MTVFARRTLSAVPLRGVDGEVVDLPLRRWLRQRLEELEAKLDQLKDETDGRSVTSLASIDGRTDAYVEAVSRLLDGVPPEEWTYVTESLRNADAAAVILFGLGSILEAQPLDPPLLQEELRSVRVAALVAGISSQFGRPCTCGSSHGTGLPRHDTALREAVAAVCARLGKKVEPQPRLVEDGTHWAVVGCIRPGSRGLILKVATLNAALSELSIKDAETAMKRRWLTGEKPVPLVELGSDGLFRLQADLDAFTSGDDDGRAQAVLDRLRAAIVKVSEPHSLTAGNIAIINKQLAVYSLEVPEGREAEEGGDYYWIASTEVVERSTTTSLNNAPAVPEGQLETDGSGLRGVGRFS